MRDKIEETRRNIAEIEARASDIMEEVKSMVDSDSRMKADEAYRDSIISVKLKEVQTLQQKSQYHQGELRKLQIQMGSSQERGSVTRSRASVTESTSQLSAVAVNLQRMSRVQEQTSLYVTAVPKSAPRSLTTEEQSASIKALQDCRNWLVSREKSLGRLLERADLYEPSDPATAVLFASIQSIRRRTDYICNQLQSGQPNGDLVNELQKIIQYTQTVET